MRVRIQNSVRNSNISNFVYILIFLILVPAAFNHWNSGVTYTKPLNYVLSIHSSKAVLTDHIPMTRYSYSDALFLMVEKLGRKHQVCTSAFRNRLSQALLTSYR